MGRLETHVTFKPADGSDEIAGTVTPSMWARADEYRDRLKLWKPGHSDLWYAVQFQCAEFLACAHFNGIVETDINPDNVAGSYEAIIGFLDAYDVDIAPVPKDEPQPDPSTAGRDGGPEE